MFNKKGQGTIEYLIIIAIVVVIALVVVSLLLDVMSNSGGINEQTAKATWQSSEPWGIVEWSLDGTSDDLTVVLRNNSFETLEFNSITTDGSTGNDINDTVASVPPGATLIRIIELTDSYDSGNRFSIAKSNILIDYNSGNINNRTQYGTADIVGTVQ